MILDIKKMTKRGNFYDNIKLQITTCNEIFNLRKK